MLTLLPPLRRVASLAALACALIPIAAAAANDETDERWIPLFNGKDLSGWTVKVAKHPLGVNFADTFRVEDGVLKVSYDHYGPFDQQFAHLYSNHAYSHYILRLEYRLTGKAAKDVPHWAQLNSGVMVHCQSPLTLALDQAWPVSMEFQFLATGATAGTQTGNVCTPGTNLELNGGLVAAHIIEGALLALELGLRGASITAPFKVDIVPYSEDMPEFVMRALQPAKVAAYAAKHTGEKYLVAPNKGL